MLPVHKSSSSKRSSEEPKRIPALAYVAACFAIGVLIGKALRPEMAEFAPAGADAAAAAPAATSGADRCGDTKKAGGPVTARATPSTTPGTRTPRRTASGRTGTTNTSTTGTRPSALPALRPRPGKTRRRRELLPRAGRLLVGRRRERSNSSSSRHGARRRLTAWRRAGPDIQLEPTEK